MTILLKQLFTLIKLLNSENGENQMALGISLGLILGFSPLFSLQSILIIFILLIFRIQFGAAFFSSFVFAFIAYLFDPLCDLLGRYVLEIEALRPVYETLYTLPIIPFTKFYNSIVMGSFVVALILFPFVFFISRTLIIKYRETVLERIKKSKVFIALKGTTVFKLYLKYNELYG